MVVAVRGQAIPVGPHKGQLLQAPDGVALNLSNQPPVKIPGVAQQFLQHPRLLHQLPPLQQQMAGATPLHGATMLKLLPLLLRLPYPATPGRHLPVVEPHPGVQLHP